MFSCVCICVFVVNVCSWVARLLSFTFYMMLENVKYWGRILECRYFLYSYLVGGPY